MKTLRAVGVAVNFIDFVSYNISAATGGLINQLNISQ